MATNTFQSGGVDLNWSTVGNWSLGHVPLAGEDVVIPNTLATVLDVVRAPATAGTFLSLTGTGTGQITIALGTQSTEIDSTTITCGTSTTGFIQVNDVTANVLTINATNLNGGAGSTYICLIHNGTGTINITSNIGANGIKNASTGIINITGNVTGGTSSSYKGIINVLTGTINITGNCTAGSGNYSNAVDNMSTGPLSITNGTITGGTGNYSTGVSSILVAPTFTNVNLVHTIKALAYNGYSPTWTPGAANTQVWPTGTSTTWAPVVAAGNLKKDVVNGTVTGTLLPTHGIL